MNTIEHRAILIMVFVMVAFNTVFLSANGLFMLVAPEPWYNLVPGVTDTGFFNQHFIRDIGIIQLFIGVAFGIGMWKPARRVGLWGAATLWLIAHALFHVWEVAVGICSPSALVRDFPAVSMPALMGIALTTWAWLTPKATRAAEYLVVWIPGFLAVPECVDQCVQEAIVIEIAMAAFGAQGGRDLIDAVEAPRGMVRFG